MTEYMYQWFIFKNTKQKYLQFVTIAISIQFFFKKKNTVPFLKTQNSILIYFFFLSLNPMRKVQKQNSGSHQIQHVCFHCEENSKAECHYAQ